MQWNKLAGSESYGKLSDSDKEVFRDKYFDRFISPQLKEGERESTYNYFREKSGGDIQASREYSDIGTHIAGALEGAVGNTLKGVGEYGRSVLGGHAIGSEEAGEIVRKVEQDGYENIGEDREELFDWAGDTTLGGILRTVVPPINNYFSEEKMIDTQDALEALQPVIQESKKSGKELTKEDILTMVNDHNTAIRNGDSVGDAVGNSLKKVFGYLGDTLTGSQDRLNESLSYKYQKDKQNSQLSGDLLDPESWDAGKDPSMSGWLSNAIDIAGSITPQIALAYATRGKSLNFQMATGAISGGSQAVGAVNKGIKDEIEKLSKSELREQSSLYADLIDMGVSDEEARANTILAIQQEAGDKTAIVAGAGGAVTSYIFSPLKKIGGSSFAGQVGAKTGAESLEEGIQETVEGVVEKDAYNKQAGFKKDVWEDSFGNFVLGFIGGAGAGAPGAIATSKNDVAKKKHEAEKEQFDSELKQNAGDALRNLQDKYSQLKVHTNNLLETDFVPESDPDFVVDQEGNAKGRDYVQPLLGDDGVIYGGDENKREKVKPKKDGMDASFNQEREEGEANTYNFRKNKELKKLHSSRLNSFNQETQNINDIIFKDTKGYLDATYSIETQNKNLWDLAREAGGINKEEAIANGIEPVAIAELNSINPFRPVFSKIGLSMDDFSIFLNDNNVITPYGKDIDGVRTSDYVSEVIDNKASGEHSSDANIIASAGIEFIPDFESIKESLSEEFPKLTNKQIIEAVGSDKPNKRKKKIVKEIKKQISFLSEDLHQDRKNDFEQRLIAEFNEKANPPQEIDESDRHLNEVDLAEEPSLINGEKNNELESYKADKKQEVDVAESNARKSVEEPGQNQTATNTKEEIELKANETNTEPTEKQIEAGNYKKGRVEIHGLKIAIENPKGSTRSGIDPNGKKWSVTMNHHYGDISRTEGADGDPVDVFIGNNPESENVFIVDQVDAKGGFDEHKVMLGFNNQPQAITAYKSNYSKGWKVGPVTKMNVSEFKGWLKKGNTTKKLEGVENETFKELPKFVKTHELGDGSSVMKDGEFYVDEFGLRHGEGRLKKVSVDKKEKPKKKQTSNKMLEDVGEKIGSARKDLSKKSDKPAKKSTKEQKEKLKKTYHKDFKVIKSSEIVAAQVWGTTAVNDIPDHYIVYNSRKKRPLTKRLGNFTYGQSLNFSQYYQYAETLEEAEMIAAVAAVSKKHRVQYYSEGDVQKYRIVRDVTDRKRVSIKDGFDNRDDAKTYLVKNAVEIYETKTSFGEELIQTIADPRRKGVDYRKGKDINAKEFKDTFGFRAVEFGNWNNSEERQEVVNSAYDGLMDLSKLLGIPAKALSLDGELALAFGARGKGLSGAKAHYEPVRLVINLTKMKGSGALAHEWFHAFDSYMARLDGVFDNEFKAAEDGTKQFELTRWQTIEDLYLSHGGKTKTNMRESLSNVYGGLIKSLVSTQSVDKESHQKAVDRNDRWIKETEDRIVQDFAGIRKYLAEPVSSTYKKRNTKPATAAQLKALDKHILNLVTGKSSPLETKMLSDVTGSKSWASIEINDDLAEIAKIYKKVRGKYPINADYKGILNRVISTMQQLERKKETSQSLISSGAENNKKTSPTQYYRDSFDIDQGRVGDYWSTIHEMGARAFSSWVEDKNDQQETKSEFLSFGSDNAIYAIYNVRPFPDHQERKAFNAGFEKLFKEINAKETDKGAALYSLKSTFSSNKELVIEVSDLNISYKSLTELKMKAKVFARENFAGKTVVNNSDESEILIPWSGIKKSLSGKITENSALASYKLDEVIYSAKLVSSEKDSKYRNNIKAIHNYESKVIINGKEVLLRVVVREALDGNRYYDHSEIKQKNLAPGELNKSDSIQESGEVSKAILAQVDKKIDLGGFQPNSDRDSKLRKARTSEGKAEKPINKESIQKVKDWVVSSFPNASVEFVNNENELPEVISSQIAQDSNQGRVKGLFFDGKVYIVGSAHSTEADLIKTVLHETVGHFGIKSFLGSEYNSFIDDVYSSMTPKQRAEIAKHQGLKLSDKKRIAEEYIAEAAEKNESPTILERIISYFKDALRRIQFFESKITLSDNDIKVALAKSKSFLKAQKRKSVSDILLTRTAKSKAGEVIEMQGKADRVLSQIRKKRDTAYKLLECVNG